MFHIRIKWSWITISRHGNWFKRKTLKSICFAGIRCGTKTETSFFSFLYPQFLFPADNFSVESQFHHMETCIFTDNSHAWISESCNDNDICNMSETVHDHFCGYLWHSQAVCTLVQKQTDKLYCNGMLNKAKTLRLGGISFMTAVSLIHNTDKTSHFYTHQACFSHVLRHYRLTGVMCMWSWLHVEWR